MDIKTYKTTKQTLINVPSPSQTRTYKPVTHEQLIDLTLNSIIGAGFKLDKETYSSARNGNVANGRYTVSDICDSEMQIQIGWQNSLDKSITLKFAIGLQIFICSNGALHGDMGTFKKKHQGDIQEFTPRTITEYIKRAGDVFKYMQKERDQMKSIDLSDKVKAELIGRMFIEEEFITSTQLNIIKNQLKHPEFDYKCPNTLWELYNYTTQSMREIHPSLWMENHISAHKFFVNESGMLQSAPKILVPEPSGPHPQIEIFQ